MLKKEMDVKLNSESMYNLGNLALSIHGRGGGLGGGDVEEEDEMVSMFPWIALLAFDIKIIEIILLHKGMSAMWIFWPLTSLINYSL